MPDEEALSEEELLTDAGGETEEIESFVTDFMDEAEDEPDAAEAAADSVGVPEFDATEAELPEAVDAGADEDDDGEVSVFAYTRAPARSAEDEEEFDRDNIKAAVMRLRKEERTPEQPMSEWDDDE